MNEWAHPPQQHRSRKTERAILDALSALLQRKSFPDITVAELAVEASVSIGGFYARFPSKEALLGVLEISILQQFNIIAEKALARELFVGKTIGDIAQAYTRLLVTNFRTYRIEIIQILQYSSKALDMQDRLRRFNVGVHDRMRGLLGEHRAQIRGPDPDRTINLALFFAGASAREAILLRNLSVYPVEIDDEELAMEISTAMTAYLEAP